VRCTAAGPTGDVDAIELVSVVGAPRGTMDGARARARVSGRDLCRVDVTFEVRIETAIYTSASNDETVWEVDLATGEKVPFVRGIPLVYGLAVDRTGSLYVLRGDCQVGRVEGAAGARRFAPIADPLDDCARLAVGPDGALYAAEGRVVRRIDLYTHAVTEHGRIDDGLAEWGATFITGLAFAPDGTLYVAEHWRSVLAIPPGGGVGRAVSAAPPMGFRELDNPWNEGVTIGPDGLVYVSVFPADPHGGFVFRFGADGAPEVVFDLAAISRDVPTTSYAGIHALSFAMDGAMYFTNQNTRGNTYEPRGQLLVARDDGPIGLVADGFNFDWVYGYDGDMTVGTRSLDTVTAPVDDAGFVEAELDVPATHGAYEVRALVTDPTTGRVFVDSRVVRD
jgi:hypothetical protein